MTEEATDEKIKGGAARKEKVIRVMLVDDHPLVRKGIRAVLEREPDLRVCAETGTAAEALVLADAVPGPDAAIVDLTLADTGGLELIRDLLARHPDLRVLVFSMHDENLYAERALRTGAKGYVMKQDPPERVLEGLRAVLAGQLFVSAETADLLLNTFVGGVKRNAGRVGVHRLSDRELQIFEAIGVGQTSREIAKRFRLSPKTVETYRSHIKRKLGLGNAGELLRAAIHWFENEAASTQGAVQPGANGES